MGKVKKTGAGKATKAAAPTFTVRELDPIDKCGPDTSVQLLYRVDEQQERAVQAHLVFFDRHGWYCEHGRSCPAVSHAQRDAKRNHADMVLAYHKLDRLKPAG